MLKALFLILTLTVSLGLQAQNSISVPVKQHQINIGETFFGIARAYNIAPAELYKANPGIQADSIRPGQLINIPVFKEEKNVQKEVPSKPKNGKPFNPNPFNEKNGQATPVKSESKPVATPTEPAPAYKPSKSSTTVSEGNANEHYHVVAEKQTLFAISRLYDVKVADILTWNPDAAAGIQPGMKLLIKKAKVLPVEPKPEEVKEKPLSIPDYSKDSEVQKAKIATPKAGLQEQLYQSFLQAKSKGAEAQTSRVSISWLNTENPKMSTGYFALHKTAKVGTIIKVMNLVNKKFVFVKVIGKLPETADNLNIVMRTSSQAQKELQLGSDKAYVELEFYP